MDELNKLDIVLDEIASLFHLDKEYTSLIRDNIVKRSTYYKNITPVFDNEVIYIKNSSTILDFFINRLLNNVRIYQLNKVYNSNNTENKEYDYHTQTLKLSDEKIISDVTYSKLKNRMNEVDLEFSKKVNNKIIFHEIGHVLQTAFIGTVGEKDNLYKQLIDSLVQKHPDIFIKPDYTQELTIKQNGLIPVPLDDDKKNIRDYYSKKDNINMLDDIFNEDESIQINNLYSIQNTYNFGNECYKNVYNFESINYKITTYAKMMKIVLGHNKSFRSMYIDSIEMYEFFDQFQPLATEIFKHNVESKKPVVSCILTALDNIKNKNSLKDLLNLDFFFIRCFEKRIKYLINHNHDKNDLIEMRTYLRQFEEILTKCKNGKLNHDFVVDNIKKILNNAS